jgi:hypothetical protein
MLDPLVLVAAGAVMGAIARRLAERARVVVPMDTVDNSNSAWELGISHFRDRGTPTGQAQAMPAHRPTISGVATRITACPRPIGAC